MKKLYPLLPLLLASAFHLQAQGVASISTTQNFTTATTGAVIPNNFTTAGGPAGSVGFRMTYYILCTGTPCVPTGTVSALSVEVDGAASATGSYTALTPAVGGGSGSGATLNPVTTSPQGQNNLCCDFYPFLHIKVNTLTVATGSPILVVKIIGYAGTSAAANGGGGGPIAATTNTLKGDGAGNAVAVTGTGTNCVLVNGTSTACSGGATGNASQVVTYTPAASVTLTCPTATAGTVVTFDPGGVALAANMALTFASCTTGELVMVRVIQAASGGPFTVSGLPTGSPQISTYPSAGTIYTLEASAATTMNFVNVAANAGASSLGAGANGISRTVTTGTGVTVNLLASSDASNPTKYNTSGLGGCGSGVAAYSATSGNTFELYSVPGTVLTMVADGTITAGHLLTGGASTGGRVADTGTNQRTSVPIGTCIVGRALASATVGNTLLVAYDGASASGQGAASSVAWNAITNPTGNLSLTMGANTSLFTYNATTGAGVDLFKLTDTASNTGTGFLMHLTTASGSALAPWEADANGVGCSVNVSGQMVCTSSVSIGAASAGTRILNVTPSTANGDGITLNAPATTSGNGQSWRFLLQDAAKTDSILWGNSGSAYTTGGSLGWVGNSMSFLYLPTEFRIGAGGGATPIMDFLTNGNVSFPFGTVAINGLIATAAAPTVAAAQIGYGSTTAASSNCGGTILGATNCIVVNVAGTTEYLPYFAGGAISNVIPIANGGTNATSAAAGTMPNATSGTASSWTATPTLGASGTLGSLTMGNATSGLVTLNTVTGALGTVTASLPANTGTIAELNLAQSWSALQSFPASDIAIAGTTITGVTGTGNVVLGTSPQFGNITVGGGTILGPGSNTSLTIGTSNYSTATGGGTQLIFATGTVSNTSGLDLGVVIKPTINQASGTGSYSVFDIDPTVTAQGSGAQTLQRWMSGAAINASMSFGGVLTDNGEIFTSAAPTVAASQVGFGSTTAVASNCTFTVITATACLVINVAGTTRYIPFQ